MKGSTGTETCHISVCPSVEMHRIYFKTNFKKLTLPTETSQAAQYEYSVATCMQVAALNVSKPKFVCFCNYIHLHQKYLHQQIAFLCISAVCLL